MLLARLSGPNKGGGAYNSTGAINSTGGINSTPLRIFLRRQLVAPLNAVVFHYGGLDKGLSPARPCAQLFPGPSRAHHVLSYSMARAEPPMCCERKGEGRGGTLLGGPEQSPHHVL